MAVTSSVGARFRQRKISVKQTLQILRQSDVPDLEKEDQQREIQHVETGVEKHEEAEVHLQRLMAANTYTSNNKQAQLETEAVVTEERQPSAVKDTSHNIKHSTTATDGSTSNENKYFIPTPDASKLWKDAKKYYNGKFILTDEYIKTTMTVEDMRGTPYYMNEDDEEFLVKYNKDSKKPKLLEDEFELIIYKFDDTISKKQPFIKIDPTAILTFDQIRDYLKVVDEISKDHIIDLLKKDLGVNKFNTTLDSDSCNLDKIRKLTKLLDLYGADVYQYWKNKRISRDGAQLLPELKFEDPNDKSNNNDDDPYICFRRREFRQQRKTRKTDLQSSEKLKRLHIEMKSVQTLLMEVAKREIKKKELLETEKQLFDDRNKFKTLKRELKILEDDELLYPQRKKIILQPPKEKPEQAKPEVVNEATATDQDTSNNNKKSRSKKPEKKKGDSIDQSSSTASSLLEKSLSGSNLVGPTISASLTVEDTVGNAQNEKQNSGDTLPNYVKLPPSKIPILELETVSEVLNTKTNSIEQLVNEKLKSRHHNENNEDWLNFTDNPYIPLFTLSNSTIGDSIKEYTHLPYSSIVSSSFEVQTSNYIDLELQSSLQSGIYPDDRKPFVFDQNIVNAYHDHDQPTFSEPGFNSSDSPDKNKLVDQTKMSLIELLDHKGHLGSNQKTSNSVNGNSDSLLKSEGYTHLDLSKYAVPELFNPYDEANSKPNVSYPVLRLRKRVGRGGRIMVDRRGMINRCDFKLSDFITFDDEDNESKLNDELQAYRIPLAELQILSNRVDKDRGCNIYDSEIDKYIRHESRWRFDNDRSNQMEHEVHPLSYDPSKLNCISNDTQSIRFGSMLFTKAYESYKEAQMLRQQHLINTRKKLQMQYQQQKLQQIKQQKQQMQRLKAVTAAATSSNVPSSGAPKSNNATTAS